MRRSTQLLGLTIISALLANLHFTAKASATVPNPFAHSPIDPFPLSLLTPSSQTLAQITNSSDNIDEIEQLLQRGLEQLQGGQYSEAIASLEQLLEIARAAGNRQAEGAVLSVLGYVYQSLGEYERTIDPYQQSLVIAREIGDRAGEGTALGNLGAIFLSLGQYERAIDPYQQSLVIAREIGDRIEESTALVNLGYAYDSLDQYEQAIDFYQQSLVVIREIGDRAVESAALRNLGATYVSLSQYEQAIDLFQQSLAIAREIGDRTLEGNALGNLGYAYEDLSQHDQALDLYQQSLALFREIGDRAGESITLVGLGVIYNNLGQYERAIDLHQQSLAIAREIGDRVAEGNALGALGNAYGDLDQYERAIDLYQQSLAIFREIGNRVREGNALGGLGSIYTKLGQYGQAIDLQQQSLAIDREVSNPRGEGITLGNLGLTYRRLGQYERAVDYSQQALAIFREIGYLAGEGTTLGNLGSAYAILGQYERAIDLYQQSLAIAREIGDQAEEGDALGNLGAVHSALGQYERAIDLHQQSLAITREIGNRGREGETIVNLGVTYWLLGQYERAIDLFQQQLVITRKIGDRAGEAIALNNQGSALNDSNKFAEAAAVLEQSIQVYESLRDELSDNQLIAIADTQRSAYLNLEKALVAQDQTAEALAVTERSRGRAFVLQLASRLADEEERAVLEASPIAQIPTVSEIQQIARDTNTTLVTYSLIFDQAIFIWVVQPTGDIEFRSVEFEGAGDRGIINPITAIDSPVYRNASPESALTALVTDSRSAVNESSNANTPQLQELHQVLIDPIADLLPSNPNDQVAFVPQGELFLVPFAALQDEDGTYLIEKYTILTAPSIQVFGLANEAGQGTGNSEQEIGVNSQNALVVGNPTMPTVWLPNEAGDLTETQLAYLRGAKAEAEAIGEFFDIPVLTGEQATEARIKQELPNASLIHLATHGLLEYGIPKSSGVLDLPGAVALAPGDGEDGLLTSAEILQMDLQADLAILSACDTGRGRITGDGVVGLSRALITAGVPSVMVSLWAVNDDSTSILMQRFYEFLATGEFTKAEALRQAQLSLLYDEDVETRLEAVSRNAPIPTIDGVPVGQFAEGDRHPYHWAPFVLIGNGR